MRSTNPLVTTCLVAVGLLASSAPSAQAARKPITGKLSKPGYTVIALAPNGKATSVRARRGRFRLRPPAERVTVHLRAPNGTYAGPVVIGRKKKGKRAILGVRAGARLGKIGVRRGYAKVVRRLRNKWTDASRIARARKGVPIGARGFGLVRSRPSRGSVPGDLDLDGIPEPLDIDDDGDLILDNVDRSTAGRGARAAQTDNCGPNNIYCTIAASGVGGGISDTVNANASTFTTADIDAALSSTGVLRIHDPPGDSVELDCGGAVPAGLPYCAPGGTGATTFTGARRAFPGPAGGTFDTDGDGFGTLDPALTGCPGCFDSFLAHGATSDQIGSGDVLIERVTTGGVETQLPATLNLVLVTVPALVSYSDTAGNSATVSYPVAAPTPGCPPPGCPPGGPGNFGNGFPVSAPAGEDVVLTLTFWRPQRKPIPPETADWIDIGNLKYTVGGFYNPDVPPPQPTTGPCPQSAFPSWGPNLTPDLHPIQGFGLKDSVVDQPAAAANTVTYTLNVTKCLATTGLAWGPGDELQFQFAAGDGADDAGQRVVFKRQ